MRTSFFIIMLSALSFVSSAQISQETYRAVSGELSEPPSLLSFSASISADTGSSFRLLISNPEMKKLHVYIRHAVFGVVADATINEKQYACRYDLSAADDGRYRIIISHGKERVVKTVEVKTFTTVSRNVMVK